MMFFVKLSILLLFLRIFTVSRTFKVIAWGTVASISAYSLAGLTGTIVACKPQSGSCKSINELGVASSALNIVTDLIILVLPLRQVWNLQATPRQKIGLIVIFTTGSLYDFASAIVRSLPGR